MGSDEPPFPKKPNNQQVKMEGGSGAAKGKEEGRERPRQEDMCRDPTQER